MSNDDSPVRAWYKAAPTDVEGMRAVLHPDVVFRVCAGWPNGGTYEGPNAVLNDFFPDAAKSWERVKPSVEDMIEAGDKVVVRGRYEGIAKPSGAPFSVQFVHIWRITDGKLIELDQIADSVILADAIAGRPQTR